MLRQGPDRGKCSLRRCSASTGARSAAACAAALSAACEGCAHVAVGGGGSGMVRVGERYLGIAREVSIDGRHLCLDVASATFGTRRRARLAAGTPGLCASIV